MIIVKEDGIETEGKNVLPWCIEHWNELRVAIDKRGLSKFIAPDGAEATRRISEIMYGNTTQDTFEPLLGAFMMISIALLEAVGPLEECPFCLAIKDGVPEAVHSHIEGAADESLRVAIELGLMETH